jgi:hypothetical protein
MSSVRQRRDRIYLGLDVHKDSISARRPACEEEERPSTATIAATPIAIPSADSAARIRRVRRPMLATRARSEGRIRGEPMSASALVTGAGC